ncbi:MAG: radical SAM protein [Patescibacteria group bacterium]|nr:radical SAM protein [Patescibacteria group bacterium]
MKNLNVGGIWLTVNRACNFRCKWCYAEETAYKKDVDMPYELAKKIIKLSKDIGVSSIILIGGEPTLWPHIFDTINDVHENGMKVALVTNGYMFSDENFLRKFKDSKTDSVSISLKAGNAQQHEELTGNKEFQKVLSGIQNLSVFTDVNFNVSITVSKLISYNLSEIVETAVINGAKEILVDFCAPVFFEQTPQRGYMMSPEETVECLTSHYEKINELVGSNFSFQQSLPYCIWPQEFITKARERNQIFSVCHIFGRQGMVFNEKGQLIPCNCLYEFPLGKYGEDFDDVESLKSFWYSENMNRTYNKLTSYPMQSCAECKNYTVCGGGCPLNWLIFNPNKLNKEV